jgi:hypothetical protein
MQLGTDIYDVSGVGGKIEELGKNALTWIRLFRLVCCPKPVTIMPMACPVDTFSCKYQNSQVFLILSSLDKVQLILFVYISKFPSVSYFKYV